MMKQLNPFEHFKEGVAHRGGGFVGGFTGGLLSACFSRVGAFIIVAAASVVLVMIAMKKTPKDAANAFTDSMKRRTEQRDVRRAEREQMLKERREREEEKRLAEEERAAFARQNDVQTSDDAPDEEEGGDVGFGARPGGLETAPLQLERLALKLQALFRERRKGNRLFRHLSPISW